jgi:hypothetical protein
MTVMLPFELPPKLFIVTLPNLEQVSLGLPRDFTGDAATIP